MIRIRRADERGHTDWGWLDSRHTFSFGDYYDPAHLGFRALRVINDDRVQAGGGFPTHGHRDMEILSYVLSGALAHKDSMGTGSVIRPGELQMMRAGTGVTHSEFNHSKDEGVHFLQIWILPDRRNLPPAYAQHAVDLESARRRMVLLAAGDGRNSTIQLHQDVDLWLAVPAPGDRREHALAPGRHAWIHVARGAVDVEASGHTHALREGDGAAISGVSSVAITGVGVQPAEILLFDLA